MTTKHTPGPWTTTGPNVRTDIGALVATAQNHWYDHETPQEEKEANAQLMSAAPELLAALEEITELIQWSESGGEEERAYDAARAAIAKAEMKS